MSTTKGYIDAITARLQVFGLPPSVTRPIVAEILQEVQHRIYQDVMANLADIARDLSPHTERKTA